MSVSGRPFTPEIRTRSFPSAREQNGGEVGDAVRRDVLGRVADFVQQLFFDRLDGHQAAGAVVLRDDDRSRPRRASAIGNPMWAMSGTERQSAEKFPPDACPPHSRMCPATVPAASRSQSDHAPAEFVDHRREREAGVGRPARDRRSPRPGRGPRRSARHRSRRLRSRSSP